LVRLIGGIVIADDLLEIGGYGSAEEHFQIVNKDKSTEE